MKTLLTILFSGCFCLVLAQDDTPKISLSYNDMDIREVLSQIEEATGYHFFYLEEWFGGKTISGSYEDVPLSTVLQDIFQDTVTNFYILDGKSVIITNNNLILDQLPGNFFRDQEEVVIEEEPAPAVEPIFYDQEQTGEISPVETVRIGRQKKIPRQKFLLSGYATNEANGKPIPEMAIVVEGKNIGTATDDRGYYEIELPKGTNMLKTSALGIQSTRKRVIIYDDGALNFDLGESVEVLEEVVVEGNRDKNVEQAVLGVTQLEVERIKTIPLVLGERDILNAAVTLPGITTAGEGAAGYNVRGGRTDQNLILLDNAVIYNPSHFFGIFSALNPFTTSDVNIYKGRIPAEYGGRLSSVFDIRTKDGNTQKISGEASIGPVTNSLMLELPVFKEKSSLLIGGRLTYSDWILRTLEEESLKRSTASFYDVVAKYNHTFNENNGLKVTGYYSRDAFSITSDSLYRYSNRLFSLTYDHKFNDKSSGEILASNSEYRFNIAFDGDSNDDFDLGYKNYETEVKLKMKYLLNDAHTFDYGLSGKLYRVDPGAISPLNDTSDITYLMIPREKGLEAAVFLSDSFKLSDQLLLDVGLRYSFYAALGPSSQRIYEEDMPRNASTLTETREYGDNEVIETYDGPEVRVSARYLISPDFSIKAGYNSTFQYIHTLSSNTTVSPTDTWKLTDINIKPQEADQYSLGLYRNFDDNKYEISLEGYYKKSKNQLDYRTGAQLLLNETIEAEVLQGDGKAYGIEFLLKKNEGRLNGWLGYTYSRSFVKLDSEFDEDRVNNGAFFPSNFDKPHDLSLVANYRFTRRFSASANFAYQTGRPVTYPVGNFTLGNSDFVFYSDRNKFRIPDYYRLDLSFNMEGNHKIKKFAHSFWSFSIYNVLGRNNPYSVFFVTEEGEIKAFQSSIFSIPVPTISYNFRF